MTCCGHPHKKRAKAILKLICRDRSSRTLLLALVLTIAMGLMRPNKPQGMYVKRFWAAKISWRDYADVVITGDSRVLWGVSPGQMQETLSARRIVNYGFINNMYVPEYLEAAEQVLRRQSDMKTIILGITPHSLTNDPDLIGQFFELKCLSKRDIFMDIHFAPLMEFFDYMSFKDAMLGISPGPVESHESLEYFVDGWLAYSKSPPGEKKQLEHYRRMYERCQVSPAVIENLLDCVSRWTESGIRVYGFLVPTCRQMVEVEKEFSGFNQAEFTVAFKEAGGIWIEIDPTAYDSFDGSHLQRKPALEFSRDLALKIYDVEQQHENMPDAD